MTTLINKCVRGCDASISYDPSSLMELERVANWYRQHVLEFHGSYRELDGSVTRAWTVETR